MVPPTHSPTPSKKKHVTNMAVILPAGKSQTTDHRLQTTEASSSAQHGAVDLSFTPFSQGFIGPSRSPCIPHCRVGNSPGDHQ